MTAIKKVIQSQKAATDILPLIVFRIGFGLMMAGSVIRFVLRGWVKEFYIDPEFHFTFYGFDWVQPLQANGMYVLFGILFFTSIFIALGFFYRISTVLFFVLFTYVELLDKTWYLNHYYFVSLVSFLMILLPANGSFSLDVKLERVKPIKEIPLFMLNIIRLQLAIVYFYAGLAKIKYDWLILCEPIKTWLSARSSYPIIGSLVDQKWFQYALAWSGLFYDLFIPFILSIRKTRALGYVAVVVFHAFTYWLFNIGMFPWIMIIFTLIFFDADQLRKWIKIPVQEVGSLKRSTYKGLVLLLVPFFVWQLAFPLRHLIYPGNLLWHEQGFRFSWHVMLMEKMGTPNLK